MKHVTTVAERKECPVGVQNGSYVSDAGVRVVNINGAPHMHLEDIQRYIVDEIGKFHKQTNPLVEAAKDARSTINELLGGIGGDMEQFKLQTSAHLTEIRQTRFAVVSEVAQITKPLGEVRAFFIASDYKEQIARLKEFVDLCERLQSLKSSGFLDTVADTMIRLAVE